jgi:hypothetical protein
MYEIYPFYWKFDIIKSKCIALNQNHTLDRQLEWSKIPINLTKLVRAFTVYKLEGLIRLPAGPPPRRQSYGMYLFSNVCIKPP